MTYSEFTSLLNSPAKLALLIVAALFVMATTSQAQSSMAETPVLASKPAPQTCRANRFFIAGESGRLHLAFMSASACTTAAMDSCNAKAVQLKQDCEYRNEDGGTTYSSCRCQSLRYGKQCYEDEGCYNGSAFLVELAPECFGIQ